MDITNIQALLDNSATIETMIDILPQDDSGEIMRLTNEDSIQSWEHSETRYVPDKGFIGMFVERTVEGVLQNISEDFNIENREIVLYLGIRRYVADLSQEDLTLPEGAYSVVANTDPKLGDFVTTFYSLGNFIVDEPNSDEVNDNTKFTAKDLTVKFNKPFNPNYTDDYFPKSFTNTLFTEHGVTALWLAQYTCRQAGVELYTTDFTNNDFIINSNQFQSGEYCRDVLKHIGALAYSWVRIGWDNKVYIDFKTKENVEQEYNNISKDNYYSLETKKQIFGAINKIILGSSIIEGDYSFKEDVEDVATNGEKSLIFNDNPILYTEALRDIAVSKSDVLFGLKYTPLTTETTGHPWLKGDDLISIIDKNDKVLYTYPFDRIISFDGHIKTTLSSYAQTEIEQDYHYKGTGSVENEKKQTKITLDRQNQTIESVVENTTKQNQKISQITQTVEELNSKIGDIADITISKESTNAFLEFENINQSEPIRIVIQPIGENISYLYPRDNLYPSDTLYPKDRTLLFKNITTQEIFPYELPADLLYYDENNYDEFILDYDGQSCVVNKRVGYNDDGTTYVLDNPTTLELEEYPRILLTDGDYEVVLNNYNNAYLFVRLMAQNIYTTQFATRAELSSEITQTKNSINAEVNGKLDTFDKEVNAQLELKVDLEKLISEINASADKINLTGNRFIVNSTNLKVSEDGTIQTKNGIFEGKITSTEGNVGGFTLGTDSFTSNIFPLKDYTDEDIRKLAQHLVEDTTLTDEEKRLYDANRDGKLNMVDVSMMRVLMNANISTTTPGKLEINCVNPINTFLIRDGAGAEIIKIGIEGITTPALHVNGRSVTELDTYSEEEITIGTWIDGKLLYRKVIELLISNGSLMNTSTGITNVENIVRMDCLVHQSKGQWRSIPWLYSPNDSSWAGGFYFNDYDKKIYFQGGENLFACDRGFMILEYTKTAD